MTASSSSSAPIERVSITAQERQDALYSHIVVRIDLPLEAQMAQCAHAAQEAMRLNPSAERPIHIVILAAASEEDLLAGARALERSNLSHHLFHEGHWPRGHTALGCAPQPKTAALKKALSRFKLWRAPAAQPAPDVVIEPTDEPLNPRLIISPSKERETRLLFVIGRLFEALSESHFDLQRGPDSARGLKAASERLERLMDRLDEMERETGVDDDQSFAYWSAFADQQRFESLWSELSYAHCGDCTAVACSCARCHMEGFLGVDTSPRSKSEGHRLLMESDARAKAAAKAQDSKSSSEPETVGS